MCDYYYQMAMEGGSREQHDKYNKTLTMLVRVEGEDAVPSRRTRDECLESAFIIMAGGSDYSVDADSSKLSKLQLLKHERAPFVGELLRKYSPALEALLRPAKFQQTFDRIDKDGDGLVSMTDVASFCEASAAGSSTSQGDSEGNTSVPFILLRDYQVWPKMKIEELRKRLVASGHLADNTAVKFWMGDTHLDREDDWLVHQAFARRHSLADGQEIVVSSVMPQLRKKPTKPAAR